MKIESETFEKSHLREFIDVPAGCLSMYIFCYHGVNLFNLRHYFLHDNSWLYSVFLIDTIN